MTREAKSPPPQAARLDTIGTVAATALAVLVLIVLAVADGQMFQDAEVSGLYQFTLNQAYSRFKASDQQVPARAQTDPIEAALAAGNVAQQPGVPAGAGASELQRLRQFGNQGAGALQLPAPGAMSRSGAQGAPAAMPDDGGPHTQKGNEHLLKHEYEQAVAEFQLALNENPDRLISRHSLADALRALGRSDEAIAAYREVLRRNPEYYCCYAHIGDVEKARNNQAAADQAYAGAIDGYKKQIAGGGAGASVARYHLARLYTDANRNLEEALALAEQANSETPNQLSHLQLLAQLYERVGRTADAAATYEKLIAISPQYAEYFQQQRQRLAGGEAPKTP